MNKRQRKKLTKQIKNNVGISAYIHFHPKFKDMTNKQLVNKFRKLLKYDEFKFNVPNTSLEMVFVDIHSDHVKELVYDVFSNNLIRVIIHCKKSGEKFEVKA